MAVDDGSPADAPPQGHAPPSIPPSADLGPRILAAVGWAVFALLAIDRLSEGPLSRLDEPLLEALPHTGAIHTASSVTTHLGDQGVLVAFALLGTAILLRRRAFIDAGILVFSKAVSVTVVFGLKVLFGRARPGIAEGSGLCCAFPSGHATETAMLFMLVAVLLFERNQRWRPWAEGVAIGLALVVGTTRLILGVHWPTDVVAGWGLGWALAGTFLLLRAFLHRQAGRRVPAAMTEPRPSPKPQEIRANAGRLRRSSNRATALGGTWVDLDTEPLPNRREPIRPLLPLLLCSSACSPPTATARSQPQSGVNRSRTSPPSKA